MININDLINITNKYIPNDEEIIRKAYDTASYYHKGQKRDNNDEYITHPLYVACILATYKADKEMVCAALLHDTLEDTKITKEEIQEKFNDEILKLVEGLTKIRKLDYFSKNEIKCANTRKILKSISEDPRIIIIKLADRIHNMRTLEFKRREKQIEISLETLEIFVPIADSLGLYKMKIELEDLCFKYLHPEEYKNVVNQRKIYTLESKETISSMLIKINQMLSKRNIPNKLKIRIKNIYGTYKRIEEGHSIDDIHDLIALQVIVDSIDNCYLTLGDVHKEYKPVPKKVRDYISNPKTNMYSSLHTTVFAPNGRLVQTQIRTFDMELVNKYGLASYLLTNPLNSSTLMQESLYKNFPFIKVLNLIDDKFDDDAEFLTHIKSELLSDKVYVYTSNGKVTELPFGSTLKDYIETLKSTKLVDSIEVVLVNEIIVPLNYELKTGDIIRIITKENVIGTKKLFDGIQLTYK